MSKTCTVFSFFFPTYYGFGLFLFSFSCCIGSSYIVGGGGGKRKEKGKEERIRSPNLSGCCLFSSLLPLNVGGRKRPRGKERKREDKEWNRLFGLLNEEKELYVGNPGRIAS